MKWKTAKRGESRTVTKFLWLPININGDHRWLERVTIRQEFNWGFWMNMEFIDKKK